jgi:uncharacterized protein YunC (DUF1805 family)
LLIEVQNMDEAISQRCVYSGKRGDVRVMDSAYDVASKNTGRDVVINASYCGVLPARFIGAVSPRGAIGVDCGVGPEGASIAGLWYLEALNIPAAVADVMTVILGNGEDLHDHGVITFVNRPAQDCGVTPGMSVASAAKLMLDNDPGDPAASEVTHRTTMATISNRQIICTDSIAFGQLEDINNVLVTAGHTGRSAVPYLLKVRPFGFICSDGGGGRDASGMAGLAMVESEGLAGATVDARKARMGDAFSSYHDGVISAVNKLAAACGVRIGMSAREAAEKLASRSL